VEYIQLPGIYFIPGDIFNREENTEAKKYLKHISNKFRQNSCDCKNFHDF